VWLNEFARVSPRHDVQGMSVVDGEPQLISDLIHGTPALSRLSPSSLLP
jgi:hypothetical protein